MALSQHLVRRYLIAKVLPPQHRKRVALNTGIPLPTLWYENKAGERWVPDPNDPYGSPPEGFIYQHSRFPRTLVENVLRLVTREAVDNCTHDEVLIDHGLIAGLEGRICRSWRQSDQTGRNPLAPKLESIREPEPFQSRVELPRRSCARDDAPLPRRDAGGR
jgi:hypothetical protein